MVRLKIIYIIKCYSMMFEIPVSSHFLQAHYYIESQHFREIDTEDNKRHCDRHSFQKLGNQL